MKVLLSLKRLEIKKTDLFALTRDESASQLETDKEIDSLRSKEATIRLESACKEEETDKDAHAEVINITKGYSRDHRPDLNQVILQLIVENQAGIPILMKPMDGNSDDKTGFRETIQTHIKQLMTAHPLKYIISDSALYNSIRLQTLAKNPGIHWISRVPESINEAKEAIEKVELSEMTVIDEQTRYQAVSSNYAGIEQRWIIIHSCQAEKRAKHTINKQCLKASTTNLKAFNNLCRKTFSSKEEAQEALQKFEKNCYSPR